VSPSMALSIILQKRDLCAVDDKNLVINNPRSKVEIPLNDNYSPFISAV